jgi:hypothetical protein
LQACGGGVVDSINEFDGDWINARATNTVFLFTWIAM